MADEKTPPEMAPLPTPAQDSAAEAVPDSALDAVAGGLGASTPTTPAAPKKRGGATGVWADASGHFD